MFKECIKESRIQSYSPFVPPCQNVIPSFVLLSPGLSKTRRWLTRFMAKPIWLRHSNGKLRTGFESLLGQTRDWTALNKVKKLFGAIAMLSFAMLLEDDAQMLRTIQIKQRCNQMGVVHSCSLELSCIYLVYFFREAAREPQMVSGGFVAAVCMRQVDLPDDGEECIALRGQHDLLLAKIQKLGQFAFQNCLMHWKEEIFVLGVSRSISFEEFTQKTFAGVYIPKQKAINFKRLSPCFPSLEPCLTPIRMGSSC